MQILLAAMENAELTQEYKIVVETLRSVQKTGKNTSVALQTALAKAGFLVTLQS